MVTLEMWSKFGKVDLGKGLVQALDMGLASFGQGIPGHNERKTREWPCEVQQYPNQRPLLPRFKDCADCSHIYSLCL